MVFFDAFKRDKGPAVRDLIWMSQAAKQNGCLKLLEQYPDAIIIAWFSATHDLYTQFLNEHGKGLEIRMARNISSIMVENKIVILLEHYPLLAKEKELIGSWNAQEIIAINALDEPLFQYFGGMRVADLMKAMNIAEDEFIEHILIHKSIEAAQHKLEKKVMMENSANSAEEWFKRNGEKA